MAQSRNEPGDAPPPGTVNARPDAPPIVLSAAAVGQTRSPILKALRVTRYDRVAALLVSLLIILGVIVNMMFVVWVTGKVWVKQAAIAPQLIEPLSGGGNALGSARDLVEPGDEEIEELLEPQLEETLDAVTDLVTDQLATLDALGGNSALTAAGGGAGDSRHPGEGGDSEVVPRWQRWQIVYVAGNLQTYARQLDYFGIELGAVGGSDEIDYAFNLTHQIPEKRIGRPEDEGRLYLTWRYGPLRAADLELLRRAGIQTDGRIIMQFVPPKIEAALAAIEQAYMEKHSRITKDVTRTVFEVFGRDGVYQFQVKSQDTH